MNSLFRRSRLAVLTATVGFGVFVGASALADEEIAEYRGEVMEAIGGHTGALAKIIGGKVAFSQDAKAHVLALAELAKMVSSIFPAGSVKKDSDALPAIWEKPAEFEKAVSTFQAAVADLAKQADAPPKEMAPAFEAVAKACKNCHDSFRKKS